MQIAECMGDGDGGGGGGYDDSSEQILSMCI